MGSGAQGGGTSVSNMDNFKIGSKLATLMVKSIYKYFCSGLKRFLKEIVLTRSIFEVEKCLFITVQNKNFARN